MNERMDLVEVEGKSSDLVCFNLTMDHLKKSVFYLRLG